MRQVDDLSTSLHQYLKGEFGLGYLFLSISPCPYFLSHGIVLP